MTNHCTAYRELQNVHENRVSINLVEQTSHSKCKAAGVLSASHLEEDIADSDDIPSAKSVPHRDDYDAFTGH